MLGSALAQIRPGSHAALIDAQIAAHPGKTGVYVLDTGEEALIARAWLVDHATRSIDVQYFIWSTDNIGILAAAALLRAAERGVKVRVLVDDLLIDAPDASLLALARHPNIDIRVYNPLTSVGVPLAKRILNVVTDFRGVNQRMHDKVVVVDGQVAITGGRNMAAEYFDYNRVYNFRDRDVVLLGAAVPGVQRNFDTFWAHPLAEPVETLYDGLGLMQKHVRLTDRQIAEVTRGLHEYARDPANFAPEVRAAIEATPTAFERLARQFIWSEVDFIADKPGKNDATRSLRGGGRTAEALAELVRGGRERVVTQSPYLVLSDEALALFGQLTARGVKVRISTNSLASTDNLPAFSGYRNQRRMLLAMGIEIFEYRPDPQVMRQLMARVPGTAGRTPIFSMHAKSMVVDSRTVYIGTFNLDPRSQNLNTEVGAIIRHADLARQVEAAIELDMAPANSWHAGRDDPDRHAGSVKRVKVRLMQLLPLRPLL